MGFVHSRAALADAEVVRARDPNAGPLTAVKGVILQSSLEELKALGHFARYATMLAPSELALLTGYLGHEWVPYASMRLHYDTCDSLRLSASELDEVARRVGERLHVRLLSLIASAARGAGFDLWPLMASVQRLSGRVFQGSTAEVRKLGPKEMLATIYQNGLMDCAYFRTGYCGATQAMLKTLGARTAYVRVAQHNALRGETVFLVSWV